MKRQDYVKKFATRMSQNPDLVLAVSVGSEEHKAEKILDKDGDPMHALFLGKGGKLPMQATKRGYVVVNTNLQAVGVPDPVTPDSVKANQDKEELAKLKAQIAAMQAQNATLQEQLEGKKEEVKPLIPTGASNEEAQKPNNATPK